jgi:hypothetical protein
MPLYSSRSLEIVAWSGDSIVKRRTGWLSRGHERSKKFLRSLEASILVCYAKTRCCGTITHQAIHDLSME